MCVIGPLGNTGYIIGGWHCGGKETEAVTVLDGLKNKLGYDVKYAQGCQIEYDSLDESLFDEAVELAKNSKSVVLCLGEHQDYSGEGYCRTDTNPCCNGGKNFFSVRFKSELKGGERLFKEEQPTRLSDDIPCRKDSKPFLYEKERENDKRCV